MRKTINLLGDRVNVLGSRHHCNVVTVLGELACTSGADSAAGGGDDCYWLSGHSVSMLLSIAPQVNRPTGGSDSWGVHPAGGVSGVAHEGVPGVRVAWPVVAFVSEVRFLQQQPASLGERGFGYARRKCSMEAGTIDRGPSIENTVAYPKGETQHTFVNSNLLGIVAPLAWFGAAFALQRS